MHDCSESLVSLVFSGQSVCIFHDVIILRTPVGEITGVFAVSSPRTAVRAAMMAKKSIAGVRTLQSATDSAKEVK